MSESFDQRLASVVAKAGMFAQLYKVVAQQRDEALRKVEELSTLLEEARKTNGQLAEQLEYLKIATIVERSEGDIKKAREFLSELVWEIDKCISQLSV